MNGRPAPQHPLARPLRACARGIYPDEAAVELLIGHGTFLDRDDFTRHITTSEHGRPGGGLRTPQSTGPPPPPPSTSAPCPCSGGERRIFRLAASLAAGLPVNLRDALTGLDGHNLTLAISAFMHASGHRPPHLEP